MERHAHNHDECGFSLIEVLVAVLILGVALVGLTRGLTVSLQSSKDAERHTVAVLLAASRVETLRAEGDFIAGEQNGEFEGVPAYRWQQTIAAAGPEGLYSVRVDVFPAAQQTDSKPVEEGSYFRLQTFLFQKPVASTLSSGGEETETERRRRRGAEGRDRRRAVR